MTTKITVDAHAGWPVLVQALDMDYDHNTRQFTNGVSLTDLGVVEANTTQDFYATDTRKILVTELKID